MLNCANLLPHLHWKLVQLEQVARLGDDQVLRATRSISPRQGRNTIAPELPVSKKKALRRSKALFYLVASQGLEPRTKGL